MGPISCKALSIFFNNKKGIILYLTILNGNISSFFLMVIQNQKLEIVSLEMFIFYITYQHDTQLLYIFKASALWADALYKSKCPSACPSACPSVCVCTFEVPFKRLFAPLPDVGCPIF